MGSSSRKSSSKLAALRTSGGNQEAMNAVVLCHGYGSSKDGFHFRAIADALAAAGLASLRFDFTGETQRARSYHVANKQRALA